MVSLEQPMEWKGKPKYLKKPYPNASSSTTNPTQFYQGSNPDRRGGKPTTNRPSNGTAYIFE
jgi:hypothetical protein